MAEEIKYPPILKRTPFVGSAGNRIVHKTDRECARAREIEPNERWYIKEIPRDDNFTLCPFCFSQETEGADHLAPKPSSTPKRPSFFKGLFSRDSRSAPAEPMAVETGRAEDSVQEDVAPIVPAPVKKKVKPATEKSSSNKKAPAAVAKKSGESSTVKKSTVRKTAAKKKPAVKKATATKKTAAKKATTKKVVAKKSPAKKTAAKKKTTVKKASTAKKAPAKKPVAKKTPSARKPGRKK